MAFSFFSVDLSRVEKQNSARTLSPFQNLWVASRRIWKYSPDTWLFILLLFSGNSPAAYKLSGDRQSKPDWLDYVRVPTASTSCNAKGYLEWFSGNSPAILQTSWAVSGRGGRRHLRGIALRSAACKKIQKKRNKLLWQNVIKIIISNTDYVRFSKNNCNVIKQNESKCANIIL